MEINKQERIRIRTWQRIGRRRREFRDVESCHPEVPDASTRRAATAVKVVDLSLLVACSLISGIIGIDNAHARRHTCCIQGADNSRE